MASRPRPSHKGNKGISMITIYKGDCRKVLANLPDQSVDCCVTSPPYFGLRDYGRKAQIGLEPTPEEFVEVLVEVFREVRRVLSDDGTVWLNLGDSYKDKQLIGVPWRVALALQNDDWHLRQDIIWSKPNVMPEPVRDRCTKAHEYIFLLSKSPRYYFDSDAIKEPVSDASLKRAESGWKSNRPSTKSNGGINVEKMGKRFVNPDGRNKRSVWTVPPKSFSDAHFAVYPPELVEPCILAGCPEGGTVLDPFGGSGTTGMVADRLNRNSIMVELNDDYVQIAQNRIETDGGMFVDLEIK